MTKESEFKEVRLLCLGMVALRGDKKGIEFVVLDNNERETSETICFILKKNTRGSAGSIYKVQKSGGTIKGRLEHDGLLGDTERRSVIQLASKAVETAQQARSQQKKSEKDDTAILELLRPLRQAYHSTNHLGRSALIARVIDYMQRGF